MFTLRRRLLVISPFLIIFMATVEGTGVTSVLTHAYCGATVMFDVLVRNYHLLPRIVSDQAILTPILGLQNEVLFREVGAFDKLATPPKYPTL